MAVYERIRSLRKNRDFTQKELATKLGMLQPRYSKYETGKNDIPTTILKALAFLHDTSADYILELTDETRPYKRAKER